MATDIQDRDLAEALASDLRLNNPGQFALEQFVLPTIQVGDLSAQRRPPIIRSAVARFTQATPGVGTAAWARFTVPNGTVAHIKHLRFHSTAALLVNVALHISAGTAPTNVGNSILADGRFSPFVIAPAGQLTFDTRARAIPVVHWQTNLVANVWQEHDMTPYGWFIGFQAGFSSPLTPDRMEIEAASDQVDLAMGIYWQEWFTGL